LDFSGAATDFCLAGFYAVVHDERPPPARVDIDGLINLVGNAPMYHRTAFSKGVARAYVAGFSAWMCKT
jgi:hypothetical protein